MRTDVDNTALADILFFFAPRDGHGVRCRAVAPTEDACSSRRMGTRRDANSALGSRGSWWAATSTPPTRWIAVPALVYSVGAYGFFALPYTIIVYPFVFAAMPKLWQVAKEHGYVTAADVVHGWYGSRALELAVAATGVIATMPYIALQLVGMATASRRWVSLASFLSSQHLSFWHLYTYASGLRAPPALIAFVKDAIDLRRGDCGGPPLSRGSSADTARYSLPLRTRSKPKARAAFCSLRTNTSPTRAWHWAQPWRHSCIHTP